MSIFSPLFWSSCSSPSPDCLRCSQPPSLYQAALQELQPSQLPACRRDVPGYNSMTATVGTVSQYIAIAVLSSVLLVIVIIAVGTLSAGNQLLDCSGHRVA